MKSIETQIEQTAEADLTFIENFIKTLNLDSTFIFQLFLVFLTFFIAKKLFIDLYSDVVAKRFSKTTGSEKEALVFQEEAQQFKKKFDLKAQENYSKFQRIFNSLKQKTEDSFFKRKKELVSNHEKNWEKIQKSLILEKTQAVQDISNQFLELKTEFIKKLQG